MDGRPAPPGPAYRRGRRWAVDRGYWPTRCGQDDGPGLWAAASLTPARVAATLDDYDNQPGSFWSHVVKALRQVGVPLEETGPALPHTRANGRAFLPRLASALAALDPPLVLVLDDLHLLTAPEPLAELAYLLKDARPGLHVVAAARIDPLAAAPAPASRGADRDPRRRPGLHRR